MIHQSLNDAVLAECREWIGTPYLHQASKKKVGCDCLGLLRGIWRHLYGQEPEAPPPYTLDWGYCDGVEHLKNAADRNLVSTRSLIPGTVILFRWKPDLPAKHLGILASEKSFIHAYERKGVVESTLGAHWRPRIAELYQFPNKPGHII